MRRLHIKPNKQTLEYAKNYMQTNGGCQEYVNEYKKEKEQAPKPPVIIQNKPLVTVTNPNSSETDQLPEPEAEKTPYKLKPPPRRPPRPPKCTVGSKQTVCESSSTKESTKPTKFESTSLKTPQAESTISYLSPIPTAPCFDSGSSLTSFNNSSLISNMCLSASLKTPPVFSSSRLTDNSMYELNSRSEAESSRSALLKSIENFKGGLKPVDSNDVSKSSYNPLSDTNSLKPESSQKKLMSQLIQALAEIRPYLSNL